MKTTDAIKKRSSTRGYTDVPLTDEELGVLIRAGLEAPTATNRQELHFTVLRGGDPLLGEIEDEMMRLWNRERGETNFYYGAPTVIVISGEREFKWSPLDAGIAVENIALAAEELGLGSVIIGCVYDALRGEKRDYFGDKLKFPEGYEYEIAVAVGHKATEKEPHTYDEGAQVTYL